ncbi:MAG: hypothetical protein ACLRMX_04195 [Lachnospira eligens]
MRDKCDKNLVVVAPTGMGKTEASLLWLNGERVLYIAICSIIECNI